MGRFLKSSVPTASTSQPTAEELACFKFLSSHKAEPRYWKPACPEQAPDIHRIPHPCLHHGMLCHRLEPKPWGEFGMAGTQYGWSARVSCEVPAQSSPAFASRRGRPATLGPPKHVKPPCSRSGRGTKMELLMGRRRSRRRPQPANLGKASGKRSFTTRLGRMPEHRGRHSFRVEA